MAKPCSTTRARCWTSTIARFPASTNLPSPVRSDWVKREPERSERGVRVWREPLVWVAAPRMGLIENGPLPLVVSPPPCVYRKRATDSLNRAKRSWRVAYSCASLAGQHAAVKAGLGITVLPKDMVPPGLTAIEQRSSLPDLHDTEIALLAARALSPPARRLHDHIVRSLEEMGGGAHLPS